MRKVLSIILIMALCFTLFACKAEEEVEDGSFEPTMAVCLVADQYGIEDNGYNQLCWEGLTRAKEELNADISYVVAEFPHFDVAIEEAVNKEVDLIICADPAFADALATAAEDYPMQAFAIIDASVAGDSVRSITYNVEQGAFLAGLIAGKMTQKNVVSFIGGVESEAQFAYQYGFEAGVSTASKTRQIATGWVNSYEDKDHAKEIAVAHSTLGAGVIYQTASLAGQGIIEAGTERGFKVICTGTDQSSLAPETVLCTVCKKVDIAAYDAVQSYIDGDFFEKGDVVYSVANGGIEISDPAGNITEEVWELVNTYTEKIKDGSLVVPSNWTDWNAYIKTL